MSSTGFDYQFWSVVGSFAIAGATLALTTSTVILVKSSKRHERLLEAQTKQIEAQTREVQVQTQTLSAPRVAIRGPFRLTEEEAFVRVVNVGLGTAEHIKVTVSWDGSTLQLPSNRWFYLSPGGSRSLHFKIPQKVERVDVKVDFTDLQGKPLGNDLLKAQVRRPSPPPSVF